MHAFLGVLLPTTLVHSQLHQRHLMQTTWFDGAHLRVCKQTANIQPFSQSRPMPKSFLGVKVHWQHCLSMEPPLSELFSVVKIDRTALLSPLATRDAASHAVDATDRGHTGPVKNGDAFERLGTMTTLADRKGTV